MILHRCPSWHTLSQLTPQRTGIRGCAKNKKKMLMARESCSKAKTPYLYVCSPGTAFNWAFCDCGANSSKESLPTKNKTKITSGATWHRYKTAVCFTFKSMQLSSFFIFTTRSKKQIYLWGHSSHNQLWSSEISVFLILGQQTHCLKSMGQYFTVILSSSSKAGSHTIQNAAKHQ